MPYPIHVVGYINLNACIRLNIQNRSLALKSGCYKKLMQDLLFRPLNYPKPRADWQQQANDGWRGFSSQLLILQNSELRHLANHI